MMKKKMELNCEEVSDIEHTLYFIDDFLIDFIEKTDDEIKEMFNGEEQDKYLFSAFIIFIRLRELRHYIKKYVLDKYYDGDDVSVKLKAQKDKCNEWNVPYFLPDDGICVSCDNQIYNTIPLKKCLTEHLTYCPYCSFAYDD